MPDLHRFFSDYYGHCFDRVAKCDYQNKIHINFNWDFLDDSMRRQLLNWVQENFYLRYSDKYLMFLEALLANETAANVLSWQEQRAIFDQLLEQKQLSDVHAAALKKRYYTPEEMEVEQKILDAEQQERERMEEARRQREFNEEYAKTENDFGKMRKLRL